MKEKNYPLYEVQPFSSIKEMIELAVRDAGDTIAYKFKDGDDLREVTFKEFADSVTKLGSFLRANELSDKHIACIGANSYNWILAYITALRSSGVFVPVDKELPEADIIHVLTDSEASVVFYDAKYEEILRSHEEELSNIRLFIGFTRDEDDGKYISFSNAIISGAAYDPNLFLSETSKSDELKLLVYTSGTTGSSKGVMLSEHNLVSSVYYGLMVSTVYDTGLSLLPYHHTYEAVSDILVSFHHHSTLCINESLTATLKNLVFYKPSYIYVVPAIAESIYKRIIRNIRKRGMEEQFNEMVEKSNALRAQGIDKRREYFGFIHETFGGKLRKIVCGGAPIRPEVAKFFDDIGLDLINGYGITECSPLVCANHDMYNDFRTVGIKLPCIEWRINEPNEEGIGEICVKGDIVMIGYYKQPELTAEVIKDGWFYTGDYGYINENEQLIISGRKKNIIVLNNGKNVYPEEIEGYIQDIDYVNEVVVSGEKDEDGNESSLTAEVFLDESARKTPAEVLKSIKKACVELPIYKQISKVVIRDSEFPKTSSNKIKRFISDTKNSVSEKYNEYKESKEPKEQKEKDKKEKKERKKESKKSKKSAENPSEA
ncbi:MAG: AMP-binding protein [Clostridia bacterium]|nr:AMP-binding protein [Clostridia bacterium]